MKITKRQLRRIIKEEKTKLLQEDYTYDPLIELYDIQQHLSDAEMKLSEVANFIRSSDGKRALQFDSLSRKAKGIKDVLETHVVPLGKMPIGNTSAEQGGIGKLQEGVDPRGLKTLLKNLGVTRSFGGVSDALSTAFYEFEGDAADMKEEVEVMSGGYRDDSGQAINWPRDVYQQIHDLYSGKKAKYKAQRNY
jgi:hypothetical protein